MAKNLNNIIARSQRLMLDENWNRQVEMGAEGAGRRRARR